jgi:hypothetical protein
VRSKFFTKLLQRSIQAFERSMTYRALKLRFNKRRIQMDLDLVFVPLQVSQNLQSESSL